MYTITLNGSYNMVLEYYENSDENRISFSVGTTCNGSGSQATYGTSDTWRGYIYDGINFNTYKGRISEGGSGNSNFVENFGGDNVIFATNTCNVQSETFSARFRLTKTFTAGAHTFIVGGDDGYHLSLDGGTTWVINQWNDHPYQTTTYTTTLSGSRNIVLEYYENAVGNSVSFTYQFGTPLPIKLLGFTG